MEILKGLSDTNQYLSLTLPNQTEIILIRDESAESSACALRVGVGSLADPRSHEGLAHLLEHVMFMGSEKFPGEAEFDRLVSNAGGESNAFTEPESTFFYFSTPSGSFERALEVFAAAFEAPRLDPDAAEREIEAVESEFQKNKASDAWREAQVLAELASCGSTVYKRNFVGGRDTLAKADIAQKMKEFFEEHYVAGNIRVAILGANPIDELRAMAIQAFGSLPVKQPPVSSVSTPKTVPFQTAPFGQKTLFCETTTPQSTSPFYGPRELGRFVELQTLADSATLSIHFFLPGQRANSRENHERLLCSLLTAEGPSSLETRLSSSGLAQGVSASFASPCSNYSEFEICIALTALGRQKHRKVLTEVAKTLAALRQEKISASSAEDVRSAAKLAFDFAKKSQPTAACLTVIDRPQGVPVQECLVWRSQIGQFRSHLMEAILEELTLDKAIVVLAGGKEAEKGEIEPLLGARYAVRKFSKTEISAFNQPTLSPSEIASLSTPPEPVTLPRNLAMLPPGEATTPQPLDGGQSRVFYQRQTNFGRPRVVALFAVSHGLAAPRPLLSAALRVFDAWFRRSARPLLRRAARAQAKFSLSAGLERMWLSLRCFSDGAGGFAAEAARALEAVVAGPAARDFELSREEARDALRDAQAAKLATRADVVWRAAMFSDAVDPEEELEAMEGLELEGFRDLLESLRVKEVWGLIAGNVTENEAREIQTKLLEPLYALHPSPMNSKVPTPQAMPVQDKLASPKASAPQSTPTVPTVLPPLPSPSSFSPSPPARLLKVPSSSRTVLLQKCPDSLDPHCYFQLSFQGPRSLRHLILFRALENYLHPLYFDEMRTRQGLGYSIGCFSFEAQRVSTFSLYIQSDKASSLYCASETRRFIAQVAGEIDQMTLEEFELIKTGIVADLRQKFRNLKAETNAFFREIYEGQLHFDLKSSLQSLASALSLSDFTLFVKDLFCSDKGSFELHFEKEEKFADLKKFFENEKKAEVFFDLENLHKKAEFFEPLRTCARVE